MIAVQSNRGRGPLRNYGCPAAQGCRHSGAGYKVFRVGAMEDALASDFSPGSLDGIGVDQEGLVSDTDAGAEYRAHLVSVMARRAVEACA